MHLRHGNSLKTSFEALVTSVWLFTLTTSSVATVPVSVSNGFSPLFSTFNTTLQATSLPFSPLAAVRPSDTTAVPGFADVNGVLSQGPGPLTPIFGLLNSTIHCPSRPLDLSIPFPSRCPKGGIGTTVSTLAFCVAFRSTRITPHAALGGRLTATGTMSAIGSSTMGALAIHGDDTINTAARFSTTPSSTLSPIALTEDSTCDFHGRSISASPPPPSTMYGSRARARPRSKSTAKYGPRPQGYLRKSSTTRFASASGRMSQQSRELSDDYDEAGSRRISLASPTQSHSKRPFPVVSRKTL
ncbi:hypothetical protein FRC04_003289 [Tulasnella sp. 424]|nr:hypothetical protein FRC04_003289 [Tulasnella sp. 424]